MILSRIRVSRIWPTKFGFGFTRARATLELEILEILAKIIARLLEKKAKENQNPK